MIKHILRNLRSLADAIIVETKFAQADSMFRATRSADEWLFEDTRHNRSVTGLPVYPTDGELTDGAAHRLELVDAVMATIAQRVQVLKDIVDTPMVGIAKPDQTVEGILFAQSPANVSLDSELFDIGGDLQYAAEYRKMPAYQIDEVSRMEHMTSRRSIPAGG